mmetsp:Transcript_2319/g.3226  ORF Transcript_2319/g.3226 Transcript_2319/m.3226 type:complete len:225 (-) Transcript_2319:109-783(-)
MVAGACLIPVTAGMIMVISQMRKMKSQSESAKRRTQRKRKIPVLPLKRNGPKKLQKKRMTPTKPMLMLMVMVMMGIQKSLRHVDGRTMRKSFFLKVWSFMVGIGERFRNTWMGVVTTRMLLLMHKSTLSSSTEMINLSLTKYERVGKAILCLESLWIHILRLDVHMVLWYLGKIPTLLKITASHQLAQSMICCLPKQGKMVLLILVAKFVQAKAEAKYHLQKEK